ncbi:hypothetical protein SZ54_0635 [Rhizobium sp. UR51a]|nr:hypothetical protein SZ54_0635 [Rhizobium sp. UR51a]
MKRREGCRRWNHAGEERLVGIEATLQTPAPLWIRWYAKGIS